ncbi:MAG TPA: hypothetical protein VLQ80_08050, partial [Candidatus Saccharimonadia bacterium]|nr:hypothetical protein [Candidatus Saccharimonadia bacterium]
MTSMRAILELNPSQLHIDSLLSQFQGLTGLNFPALDGLPSADALQVPDFGVTGMIDQFQSMAEKLAQGPDALLGALRQHLQGLGGGSLDVGGPLAAITGPLSTLGDLPTMLTTFVERGQALGGLLDQLGGQQVDGKTLRQLFQPDALVETLRQHLPFNTLTDRLQDVASLEGWLGALAEKPWLAGYQAALAAITAIPARAPVTASDLAVLNAAAVEPITRGIQGLTKAMTDAVALLTTFNGSLRPLAQRLTSGLERVCDTLDPQKLGGSLTMFDQITAALDGLNLGDIPAQLAHAAQVVEGLVAQGIEAVLAPLQTVVHTLETGLDTAKQALVKVSAIITDVLAQLHTFVEKIASTVSSVVQQVEAGLDTFMETANGVLDKVNGLLIQVFAFIRDVAQKLAAFDFRPIIKTFHAMLFKITALLESPEARQVFEQVKASLDEVAQQVESIDLSPVFDQVLGEADKVKTALAAIDLSQLNALLQQALKAALELVQSAIDPPAKVTDAVKATYADTVQAPLNAIVQPVKETFDKLLDIINQFEPGTLVSSLITPPYEALVAELKAVIDPAQVVQHLGGLRELYDNILAEVDAQ